MATFIHRCNTPDGPRYREWCTITDTYSTDDMTRAEMLEYLGPTGVERLRRADKTGTSSHVSGPRSMERWDEESGT